MSKYNHIIKVNQDFIIYNTLSNNIINVNQTIYELIKSKDFNKINSIDSIIYENLIESKIIESNDIDELYKIKLNRIIKQTANVLNLTICPTTRCNFSCFYCYENEDKKHDMNLSVENALMDYIKNFKNADQIVITWYGGEPLLKYKLITRISEKIKKLENVSSGKTSFFSSIITNGYLFNKRIIDNLEKNHITSLQITLDGNKDSHNKIRNINSTNEKDTFSIILQNIKEINEKTDVKIYLRVNISKDNKEDFVDVYNLILNEVNNKEKIFIYPGFIQNLNKCHNFDCAFNNKNEKEEFLRMEYQKDSNLLQRLYPNLRDNICVAQHINSFLIDPLGDMYKCWVDIGIPEKIILNIKDRNNVNEILLAKYITNSPFDDKSTCVNCSLLPICGGGCQKKRIEQNEFCEISKEHIIDSIKCIVENTKQ